MASEKKPHAPALSTSEQAWVHEQMNMLEGVITSRHKQDTATFAQALVGYFAGLTNASHAVYLRALPEGKQASFVAGLASPAPGQEHFPLEGTIMAKALRKQAVVTESFQQTAFQPNGQLLTVTHCVMAIPMGKEDVLQLVAPNEATPAFLALCRKAIERLHAPDPEPTVETSILPQEPSVDAAQLAHLTQLLEEAKEQLKAQQFSLEQERKQKSRLEEALSDVRRKVADLEQQVANPPAPNEGELVAAKRQIAELEAKLSQVLDSKPTTTSAETDAAAQFRHQQQLDTLQGVIGRLEDKLRKAAASLDALQEENDSLTEQNQQLKADTDQQTQQFRAELDRLAEALATRQKTESGQSAHAEQLYQQQIAELEGQLLETQRQQQALAQENKALTTQLSELTASEEAAVSALKTKEMAQEEAKAAVRTLEGQWAEKQQEWERKTEEQSVAIQKYTLALSDLQAQFVKTEDMLLEKERVWQELFAAHHQLEQDRTAWLKQEAELKDALRHTTAQYEELKAQLPISEDQEKAIEALRTEQLILEEKLSELEKAFGQAEEEIQQLQHQIEVQTPVLHMVENYRKQISELEESLAAAEGLSMQIALEMESIKEENKVLLGKKEELAHVLEQNQQLAFQLEQQGQALSAAEQLSMEISLQVEQIREENAELLRHKAELEAMMALNREFESQVAQQSQELKSAELMIQEISQQLDRLQTENQQLLAYKTDWEQAQEANRQLQLQLAEKGQALLQAQERMAMIEVLEEEKRQLLGVKADWEEAMSVSRQFKEQLEALGQENLKLEQDKRSFVFALADKDQAIEKLHESSKRLEGQLDELLREKQRLEEDLRKKDLELSEHSTESEEKLQMQKKLVFDLEHQLQTTQQQLAHLHTKLESVNELESKLQTANQVISEHVYKLRSAEYTIQSLNERLQM